MGNYIEYHYNRHHGLEHSLARIDYTGHDGSHLPDNRLLFEYTQRPLQQHYISGASTGISRLLVRVYSYTGSTPANHGTELRHYQLNYSPSAGTGRPLLRSVQECRQNTCLNPLQFTWSEPTQHYNPSGDLPTSFPQGIRSAKMADINGDAREDLVFVGQSDTFLVALARGAGGFGLPRDTGIQAPAGDPIDHRWALVDLNADNRMDLLLPYGNQWKTHLSQGDGFDPISRNTGATTNGNEDIQILDIDGDGLADLVTGEDNAQLQAWLLKPQTSAPMTQSCWS